MKVIKTQSLNLFGSKWKIQYIDDIIREGENTYWGITYHEYRIIKVATKDNNKPIDKETVRITLLHELMHVCFGEGEYWKDCDDKPLVEWMAKCFNQIIKSKIL